MKANWDYDVEYNVYSKEFQVLRSGVLMAIRVEVAPLPGTERNPLWAVWIHRKQKSDGHPNPHHVVRSFEDHFAAYFSRL